MENDMISDYTWNYTTILSLHSVRDFCRAPLWLAQLFQSFEASNVTGWEDSESSPLPSPLAHAVVLAHRVHAP